MFYKIAQLALTPGRKSNSTSDIFMSQPDTAKEAGFGKIFILAEINENSQAAAKLINYIFNEIDRNFYHNEKIVLAEKIAAIRPEHIFEATLARANINLAKFMPEEKININFNSISLTACLVHENNIHFSNLGRNKVLFIYKQKIKTKNKPSQSRNRPDAYGREEAEIYEYKIADVTKQTGEDKDLAGEDKIFSSVVSGRLLDGSAFLISNEALSEYISPNQIIEITTSLPPVGAVEQFKLILSNINSYVSFLGVLVKSASFAKQEESKKYILKSTQQSIAALNQTEDTTENLLSPSGLINFKSRLAAPFFSLFKKTAKTENANTLSLKDKIFFKKKPFSALGAGKAFNAARDILANLIGSAILAAKALTSRGGVKKAISAAQAATSQKLKNWLGIFGNLSIKNRLLLAIAVFCLAVFAVSLTIQKNRNNRLERENEIKNMSLLIEQKQNQAEANLLYNNEEGAKKLFKDIQELIEKYPQETDEQKNRHQEFTDKFNQQLEKLRKVAAVDELAAVYDLKNFSSLARPENIYFDQAEEKIYAADSSQKTIYIFDTKEKKIASLTDLTIKAEKMNNPVMAGNDIVYYPDGKSLIGFDAKKQEIKNVALAGAGDNFYASAIGFYSDNLYAADPNEGQIYKFARSGEAFTAPSKWLKDSTDIKGAADLAIDGSIYVLKNNGELIKMLRGQRTDFSLGAVDPPLAKPVKMHIAADLNLIYILEPASQRLVVFDKTGKFILQYKSDIFNDLKSFAWDEKNKLIYVLNGTEILSFKTAN